MVRVLFSSNAGFTKTGYGNQCGRVVGAIRDLGHQVAVHAWWGLEGGPVEIDNILHFPRHLDSYGNDAMPYYCKHWHADLLITLIDLWVMDPGLGHLGNTRYCPWFPIDSEPVPPAVAQRFPHAHRLLVYSKHAERLVKEYDGGKYAGKVRYIPHGIDTQTLRPCTDEEKAAFRRKLFPDWPADAFVCLMVAANKGFPSRKSFPEVMEAFAAFAQNHPEARLYLHSYAGTEFKGPPLSEMAQHFGILDRVRIANRNLLIGGDYTDEMMREIYCASDVLLAPSQGEGFGLPILEAQSCGVSVIVQDHSAMSENVGCGWRIKPLRMFPTLIWGGMAEADPREIHHAMEEAIRRPRSPHWGEIAREFALNFSWPRVVELYWKPFLAEMDAGRRELALELENARREAQATC